MVSETGAFTSTLSSVLEVVSELLQVDGTVTASHAHLFVEQEGLEDGVGGEREDRQERVRNRDRHDSHRHSRGNRLNDAQVVVRDEDVSCERRQRSDARATEKHVNETNRVSKSESVSVLDHQRVGVQSGLAERGVVQSNLDVGVLGDVLHTVLHGPEEVASKAEHGLNETVVLVGRLNLFSVVFKEETDHLTNSDAERSESN